MNLRIYWHNFIRRPKLWTQGVSGHVCHGKCVKKYEVQCVNAHESLLWQHHVVGVSPAMVKGMSTDDGVEG